MTVKINQSDVVYFAGLFDGEGHVAYKQYPCTDKRYKDKKGNYKKYLRWTIKLEINMTDQDVINWIYATFGVGSVAKKPPGKGQMGRRMQWRWRCSHRDAYSICKLIWPYVKVKLHKIEQIIDHYEPEFAADQNVVNMDEYKMRKEMMWE